MNYKEQILADVEVLKKEIPPQYPSNNWLKFHHQPKIPKWMREKRDKERLTFFRYKAFKIINDAIEKYFTSFYIKEYFDKLANIKNIDFNNKI